MWIRSLLPVTFVLLAVLGAAQPGSLSPEKQKQFDDAVRRGDKAFAGGGMDLDQARVAYETAHALRPDDASVCMKIGLCHLNGPQRTEALAWFQKAALLDERLPRLQFLLGYGYQLEGRFEEAIAAYEEHRERTRLTPDSDPVYNMADKYISECRNGRGLVASPVDAVVEGLGEDVNSSDADYGMVLSADGARMWFTSRRPGSTGGKVDKLTNERYDDIYAAQGGPGAWSVPVNAGAPLNGNGNDAVLSVTADGTTMLLYRDGGDRGDVYQSDLVNGVWTAPRKLGGGVNSKYHESSAWMTADRTWLYVVSDRPEEGLGGKDIYRCRWNKEASEWGPAENLGPDVNSRHDEDGVFLTLDGTTLYFSSKGHTSMGGYDIFRSRLEKGLWSKPENLGHPVNSPDDDIYFVLSADGTTGWFSSVRKGGLGMEDLYRVTFGPGSQVGQARSYQRTTRTVRGTPFRQACTR